jgi:hypothetical protein
MGLGVKHTIPGCLDSLSILTVPGRGQSAVSSFRPRPAFRFLYSEAASRQPSAVLLCAVRVSLRETAPRLGRFLVLGLTLTLPELSSRRMATPAPDAVKRLVDHFDQDRKVFQSSDYKEEQLRLGFLNPFFAALGWACEQFIGRVIARVGRASQSAKCKYQNAKCPEAEYATKTRSARDRRNRESIFARTTILRTCSIGLTAGHQAKVEEESEVRKAGGVRVRA